MELEEAIALVKKSHPYATKYRGVKEDEALQKLVECAETLQKVKEAGGVQIINHSHPGFNPGEKGGDRWKLKYQAKNAKRF